jgi:serine/threonine protein kinase
MLNLLSDEWSPVIPRFVHPIVRQLIEECLAKDPDERPSFVEIFNRLKEIRFRILPKVQSVKVFKFVEKIKAEETRIRSN